MLCSSSSDKKLLKASVGPGTGTRSTGGVGGAAPQKARGRSPRGRAVLQRSGSPGPTSPGFRDKSPGPLRAKSSAFLDRSPSPAGSRLAAVRSFSVDGMTQPGDMENEDDETLKNYRVGETVLLTRNRVGKIKFIGRTHFAKGPWYGIELTDKSVGNHDGMVDGRRYFKCDHRRGLFVQKKKIRKRISGKRRLIKMFVKPSGISPEMMEGEWQIWRDGEKGSRMHMCDMEVTASVSGDLYGQVRTGAMTVKPKSKKPLRAEVRGKLPLNTKQKITFTISWKPGNAMDDIPPGLSKKAKRPAKARLLRRRPNHRS